MTIRKFHVAYIFIPALLLVMATTYYFIFLYDYETFEDFKIGVLFSTKGPLATSEKPIINAIRMAVDEINDAGGINGRQVVIKLADKGSSNLTNAELAENLILNQKANVVFGCWTSACRKEVKPVIEKHENLLLYPNQYEGVELSNNIIYLGAAPNQQIIPAVKWMMDRFGKRAFLIGSDYIYPHIANEIVSQQLNSLGGKTLGVAYIPLGSEKVTKLIDKLKKLQPDFIVNTINGDSNIAFFNELTKQELRIPSISFSLTGSHVAAIDKNAYPYMYTSWTYFKKFKTSANKVFLDAYKKRYSSVVNVNDAAISAYTAVYLLKQAVLEAPNLKPMMIREKLLRQSRSSPAGPVYIDPYNHHTWRTAMIAKTAADGSFIPIWLSRSPIPPVVYPKFKTKIEWEFFIYQLYLKWNNAWEHSNG